MESVLSSEGFLLMQQFIEEHSGISIGRDKAYLIENRLARILSDSGRRSFEDFYSLLSSRRDTKLIENVIDAITTNETMWFRDITPWNVMEEVLLPSFVEALRKGKRTRVRIWSAACSSGQEPYSIAMCIDRYLRKRNITDISLSDFEILASDISGKVLETARSGKYDNVSIERGLNDECRDSYFICKGSDWIIKDCIRDRVVFKQFNLQNDFLPMGSFDIIFCRYVIIYFSEKLKKSVLKKIAGSLRTDGVLFIGSSELICDYDDSLRAEQYRNGVYYKLKG